MIKNFVNAVKTLAAWAALAVCVAYAQSSKIVAKVPFDFVVANRNMEPGEYTFTIDLVQSTVLVRGAADGSAAFAEMLFEVFSQRYERTSTLVN